MSRVSEGPGPLTVLCPGAPEGLATPVIALQMTGYQQYNTVTIGASREPAHHAVM